MRSQEIFRLENVPRRSVFGWKQLVDVTTYIATTELGLVKMHQYEDVCITVCQVAK